MNGIAFTLCLLCGCDQVEVEELVLRACVELTVPRNAWRKDVRAEIKRQKIRDTDLALEDYLCGVYYRVSVEYDLRLRFRYQWDFPARVWYASKGQLGEEVDAADLVCLNKAVLQIGRALPAAVKAGVPVVPWRERIARPK